METMINPIYYREYRIEYKATAHSSTGTWIGIVYDGETDDLRAINSFVGRTMSRIQRALAGKEKICVYHSILYTDAARKLSLLIKGLELETTVLQCDNIDKALAFLDLAE